MNKLLKALIPVSAAAGLVLFAVAPGRADEEKKAPFLGRNIAHRGLHKIDRSIPENSLAAFSAAVGRGYGIELDVHLTADDALVVFHDDDMKRMCGVDARLEDLSYDYIRTLSLAGTDQHPPLLGDVLELVDGKTPIILEVKRGKRNARLCALIREALLSYTGDVCIESFDPTIVRWWRRNAPEMLRGQLACRDEAPEMGKVKSFLLSNLLLNFLGRPQFIAYGICEKKSVFVRLCEKLGAMKVAWTSHSWANEENNDTVIFEFYRPRTKYK